MADSTNNLPQIETRQSQKEVVANTLLAAASPAMIFGRDEDTSGALTWGYLGGRWGGGLIANGTLTLPAIGVSYILADRVTGEVVLDAGSPGEWNDTDNFGRLYLVTTGTTSVTSYEDHRAGPGGIFAADGGGGSSSLASLVDVDVGTPADGDTLAFDIYLGQWVAGPPTGGPIALDDITDVDAAAPSDGEVLTFDSGTGTWLPAASTGTLNNFAEALATASPNATTNVASLTALAGSTNADAVFAAKGNGSIAAQVPDGTPTGGDKRGARSVDWQRSRTAAAQVASGTDSFIGGGADNAASGLRAAVPGGGGNTASNQDSFAVGYTNTASGNASAAVAGSANTASATYSITLGGNSNTAAGLSGVVHGTSGNDRGLSNTRVHGGSTTSQRQEMILKGQLIGPSPVVLCDGGVPNSTSQLVLANGSTYLVRGMVSARQATGGEHACWSFEASISRGANAAATAMNATCTPVAVSASAGAAAWTLTVDADTTYGCLRVTAEPVGQGGGTAAYASCVLDSVQTVY
jgi:hypothetical protein